MMRRWVLLVVTGLLIVAVPPARAVAGAEHEFVPEEYDVTEHFAAGEGFCVPWAGSFREVRRGGYRIVTAPGGRDADEFHVNGVVDGRIELTPDDPGLPSYAGSYREKVNGVVRVATTGEDVERVAQFRLRSTLLGSDGSTLSLVLSGKVTVNGRGVLVVERGRFTCG